MNRATMNVASDSATSPTSPRPLAGVTVLDLSRVLSGPLCAAILADIGADVIKVERPGSGDDSRAFGPFVRGESNYFMMVNRGKKSLTIDLKSDAGRHIVHELVRRADVLVENFRPGVTARLGLDYETVHAVNPRLIYVSISGFGQDGPIASRAAYDHIVQAMSGLMSVTGWPDSPPTRVGDAIADAIAGVYGAFAAVTALLGRGRTGAGQHVDVAMLDSLLSVEMISVIETLGGGSVSRLGNAHPISAPMDAYRAKDGYVMVAVANDRLFQRIAVAMDNPGWCGDPRFSTDPMRLAHQDELREEIERWTSVRTVDQAVRFLAEAGVPTAPILDVDQALHSEQATCRGILRSAPHPDGGEFEVMQQPVHFGAWRNSDAVRPPRLGEHTTEVLRALGHSPDEIRRLADEGVI